jgi:hypothetical protein
MLWAVVFFIKDEIGDDQNKILRHLLQGLANTSVHCIGVSVLRALHWLPLVISRFPSITIVYFTFPMQLNEKKSSRREIILKNQTNI